MYVESYQWQIGLERILILPLAPCGFDTPYLSLPPLEIATMIPVGGNDTYGVTGIPSTVGRREVVERAGLKGSTRIVYPGSGREDA